MRAARESADDATPRCRERPHLWRRAARDGQAHGQRKVYEANGDAGAQIGENVLRKAVALLGRLRADNRDAHDDDESACLVVAAINHGSSILVPVRVEHGVRSL